MYNNPLRADLEHILKHTKGLWGELRDKKIFITGGTGFFGCWLLESLIWANERLKLNIKAVVLTRDYKGFLKKAPHLARHPDVDFCEGNVTNFRFPNGSFSYIMHAATEIGLRLNKENSISMFDTIINGTRRVLDFALSHRTKKFLLTSTGAVYGRQPYNISHINEEYMEAPESAYGIGKFAAEHLCTLYSQLYGIEAKIARGFCFIGPYLPLDSYYAVGNFIKDGIKGRQVIVKGDGTPRRSYLYAADLAIWLWTILIKGKSQRPYNVGSECDVTIADLADSVAGAFGSSLKVKIMKALKRGSRAERYVPSTQRARGELGLREHIGLEDAIKKTISWYQRE